MYIIHLSSYLTHHTAYIIHHTSLITQHTTYIIHTSHILHNTPHILFDLCVQTTNLIATRLYRVEVKETPLDLRSSAEAPKSIPRRYPNRSQTDQNCHSEPLRSVLELGRQSAGSLKAFNRQAGAKRQAGRQAVSRQSEGLQCRRVLK